MPLEVVYPCSKLLFSRVFGAMGVAVAVLAGVAVTVAVLVGVDVTVGVLVGVAVLVLVLVGVTVAVLVSVAVLVGVLVNVDVIVGVAVLVDVGVIEGVAAAPLNDASSNQAMPVLYADWKWTCTCAAPAGATPLTDNRVQAVVPVGRAGELATLR